MIKVKNFTKSTSPKLIKSQLAQNLLTITSDPDSALNFYPEKKKKVRLLF